MNWTKTPPTKPGAYWFQYHNGIVAAEVRVFNGFTTARLCDGSYPRAASEFFGEWCGPLVPAEKVESLIADVMHLRNEVDCRIEHGASHGGHLDYVKLCLTQIIDAHR